MSDRVVFWYGCNVLRHGDIIHSAIEVLRAAGIESAPVGGPGYCCGSPKDANLRAAEGMAVRTVEKFNARARGQGRDLVSVLPPAHGLVHDPVSGCEFLGRSHHPDRCTRAATCWPSA